MENNLPSTLGPSSTQGPEELRSVLEEPSCPLSAMSSNLSAASPHESTSQAASSKPPSPAPNQTLPSASPNIPVPKMFKSSSFPMLKLDSSNTQTESPPLPSAAAPTKRTFASVAKRVIMQERLRKAEEEDTQDEEDGEKAFIFSLELNECMSHITGPILC